MLPENIKLPDGFEQEVAPYKKNWNPNLRGLTARHSSGFAQ